MRQRTLAALATGAVGLAALAPAFAAEGQPPAPPEDTTTSSSGPGSPPPTASTSSSSSTSSTSAPGPSSTTATTSDTAPPSDSTSPSAGSACADTKEQVPAPEQGASETFDAGEAGTVEVGRASPTELQVLGTVPNDGWTEKVATPTGPRIKVKFTNESAPDQIIRFAASLNSDGTQLRLKVSDCDA